LRESPGRGRLLAERFGHVIEEEGGGGGRRRGADGAMSERRRRTGRKEDGEGREGDEEVMVKRHVP
jgi:hypothetical protein